MAKIRITGGTIGDNGKQGATTVVSTPDNRKILHDAVQQVIIETSASLYMSGSENDYAFVPTNVHNGDLDITGELTIESWVKFDVITGTHELVSKMNDTEKQYRMYYDHDSNYLGLELSFDGSTTTLYTGSFPRVNKDQWYHFAVVRNNTGEGWEVNFHSSSILVGKATSVSSSPISTGGAEFRVGSIQSGSYPTLSGSIDEVRVWDIERTAPELLELKDEELVEFDSTLVGYWQMNFSSRDVSTNENNYLVPINGTRFTTDRPF